MLFSLRVEILLIIFLSTKFHSKWRMAYEYACGIIFLPTEYAPEEKTALKFVLVEKQNPLSTAIRDT